MSKTRMLTPSMLARLQHSLAVLSFLTAATLVPPPAAAQGGVGPCCLSWGTCVDLTELDCLATGGGGVWYGDGGTCSYSTCLRPPPVLGQCCLADGTCVVASEEACLGRPYACPPGLDGTWAGPDTRCEGDAPCGIHPGRCCFPDGRCELRFEDRCTLAGGTFFGPGTACIPDGCPGPLGACCRPHGYCSLTRAEFCDSVGGRWAGPLSTCADIDCVPFGACCVEGVCIPGLSEAECDAEFGTWQGQGTTCAADGCPPPTGACCLAGGDCEDLSAAECDTIAGWFRGLGTACDQPGSCNASLLPMFRECDPPWPPRLGRSPAVRFIAPLAEDLDVLPPGTRLVTYRVGERGESAPPSFWLLHVRRMPGGVVLDWQ